LKLLLDEMYPSLIARELRTRGHDVVSVHESLGSGTSDEQVLDHARSEGRAVLTENVRDFRPLAERRCSPPVTAMQVSSSRPRSAGRASIPAVLSTLSTFWPVRFRSSRSTPNCGCDHGASPAVAYAR